MLSGFELYPRWVPLTANNNDVKIGETRTVHFVLTIKSSSRFERIKKNEKKNQTNKFYYLFVPLKYLHVTMLLFQES